MTEIKLIQDLHKTAKINDALHASIQDFWATAPLDHGNKLALLKQMLYKENTQKLDNWLQEQLQILLAAHSCDISEPYFFVSYSSRDWKIVYPIVLDMMLQGANIWIDVELDNFGGERWSTVVKSRLRSPQFKAILFFVSTASFASVPVFREVIYSLREKYAGGGVAEVRPKLIPINIDSYHIQHNKGFSLQKIATNVTDRPIDHGQQVDFCDLIRKYCDKEFEEDIADITADIVAGSFWEYVFEKEDGFKCLDGLRPIDVQRNGSFPDICLNRPLHQSTQIATTMADKPISEQIDKPIDTSITPKRTPVQAPIAPPTQNTLQTEKTIGHTDITYKILTLGTAFHMGFALPLTVLYNGCSYPCKSHKTGKGRIDGLSRLYKEHNLQEGDVIIATYESQHCTVTIEKKP